MLLKKSILMMALSLTLSGCVYYGAIGAATGVVSGAAVGGLTGALLADFGVIHQDVPAGFKKGVCTGALIGGVAGLIAGATYGYRLESVVSDFGLAFK